MSTTLATDDASPRKEAFVAHLDDGKTVRLLDDHFSDRIRCDHPSPQLDGEALGATLRAAAEERDRGRIVALVPGGLAPGLEDAGFRVEARMPGFYRGDAPCVVMGAYPDPERASLAAPARVEEVERLVEERSLVRPCHPDVSTALATVEDAEAIAELLTETFPQYPTPSGDPAYVGEAIDEGTPFRVVRAEGEIVACASADLVTSAATAELTDCATRPDHRGNGYMQAILLDLMDDLRDMRFPTAFTLARARIAGMNLAFHRLGFELRGTMSQSCRIGEGIEDMNVWSRSLAT